MPAAINPYTPPSSLIATGPGEKARPPFPVSVKVAAALWFVFGGLRAVVAAGLIWFFMQIEVVDGVLFGAFGLLLVTGVYFTAAGIRTWKGAVTDVKGNAVGSIATGGVMFLIFFSLLHRALGGSYVKSVLTAGVLDAVLVLAGLTALMGRARFLAWKRWNPPPPVPQGGDGTNG